jgi:predicted nucleotidyltransferase
MAQETTHKINKDIEEKVLQFGKQLERDGVPVEKLVIFGSYAKNNATENSDIDVCVVSSVFGKDSLDELMMLAKESRKVDTRIEAHPASPAEFNRLESPLMWEIRKYGLEIYSA